MTRKAMIELLKAMEEHADVMAGLWGRDGNEEYANQSEGERYAYQVMIQLLTDKDYAKDMQKLFIR